MRNAISNWVQSTLWALSFQSEVYEAFVEVYEYSYMRLPLSVCSLIGPPAKLDTIQWIGSSRKLSPIARDLGVTAIRAQCRFYTIENGYSSYGLVAADHGDQSVSGKPESSL